MFRITDQNREQDREPFIVINDCCMKEGIKQCVNFLTRKSLTDVESLLLCIYYFITSTLVYFSMIKYAPIMMLLDWSVGDYVSPLIILHINIFANITIVIQMVQTTKDLVCAFLCKCDCSQHPELEERID